MWKKVLAGGFIVAMVAAVVIGAVQLAAPSAEAQSRDGGRAAGEDVFARRGNGGQGRGRALAPDT